MDGFLKKAAGSCLTLCVTAALCWGQEKSPADEVKALRELIQQQQKQINELSERLNHTITMPQPIQPIQPAQAAQPPGAEPIPAPKGGEPIPPPKGAEPIPPPAKALGAKDVQSIIADYLKANPGAGLPSGVQTGYSMGTGFYVKSVPNPDYNNWSDQSGIPWEMRFRGRIQANYDFYKVQDNYNHLTKQFYNNPNSVPPPIANPMNTVGPYTVGDFSTIEVKRMRLIWEGNIFTPNLTYEMQLDASSRGFNSFQNNKIVQNAAVPPGGAGGFGAPGINGQAASPIGGTIQTDHGARLFTAWLAYQIPLGSRSSASVPVPEGSYSYTPSLTFIAGKQQPFFSLLEILGSATSQFAEFNMANWFFDTDGNNMMTGFSAQYRDFDDRLMLIAQIFNTNDGQGTPAVQTQRTPEFIGCFWFDFGGEFDKQGRRWNLFGNSISDLNYSRNLTVRAGGALSLVHLDPRNQYGDVPASFYFVGTGGPNGTRFINQFAGGTLGNTFDLNQMNVNTFDAFVAAHYRGFSFYNEWYFRTYNGLRSLNPFTNSVVYSDFAGVNSIVNRSNFMDYGMAVQTGYFLIPKKLEVIGLYSMINSQSGDLFGTGTFTPQTIRTGAGTTAVVRSYNGAFTNYHMAQEIGAGFNYYWFGQLVKWTTDFSYYRGGNPAGNGQAATGFIPGVDGWLFQTQIQIAF